MKSRNEMRKPVRVTGIDEGKKTRKLKPLAKQKNVKQSLLKEIDELEDIDLSYRNDDIDDLNYYEEDEDE